MDNKAIMNQCSKGAAILCGLFLLLAGKANADALSSQPVRDVLFFLERLRDLGSLPVLEDSHTAMTSTFNPAGGDPDGFWFSGMAADEKTCVILDVDGPGCVNRIMDAAFNKETLDTRIQIFIDHAKTPVIDLPTKDLFTPGKSIFPRPLIDMRTYPGACLFPIPYSKHIKIQLFDPKDIPVKYLKGEEQIKTLFRQKAQSDRIAYLNRLQEEGKGWFLPRDNKWGSFFQVTYTTYAPGTLVKSLSLPFSQAEQQAADSVAEIWLRVIETTPPPPAKWTLDEQVQLAPASSKTFNIGGAGCIQEIRAAVTPDTEELRKKIRFQIFWDDAAFSSVDAPFGYLFGNADNGYEFPSDSLLFNITKSEIVFRFPMPFGKKARFVLRNDSGAPAEVRLRVAAKKSEAMPANQGYFHATWQQLVVPSARFEGLPRYGRDDLYPFFVVLEKQNVRGKYVGLMHHLHWPWSGWWGEGDPLIWSDEALNAWPPSYHGTGSEEYFNSGWCNFDKKAVSGKLKCPKMRPGEPVVYSFHLNDAFQFQKNFRFALEMNADAHKDDPHWLDFTAFWYADAPHDAMSDKGPPSMSEKKTLTSVEGESLRVISFTGKVVSQNHAGDSAGKHLWWRGGQKVGDKLLLGFNVPTTGNYQLFGRFLKARDYGLAQFTVNGVEAGKPVDFFNEVVAQTPEIALGTFALKPGENQLGITIAGANPKAAKAYMIGLDYLRLVPSPANQPIP